MEEAPPKSEVFTPAETALIPPSESALVQEPATAPEIASPPQEPEGEAETPDTTGESTPPGTGKTRAAAAREKEARKKLAEIAREVTGRMASPPPAAKAPPAPSAGGAVEGGGAEGKGKPKIATKTLAELYASQGDWARAVEVYEALLEKFPTNEAYKKRLEILKSKITEGG